MNKDIIKGKWNEIKGDVKEKWGKLTDDDLMKANGDLEKLQGSIQKRYGLEKEEAKKNLDNFIKEKHFDRDY